MLFTVLNGHLAACFVEIFMKFFNEYDKMLKECREKSPATAGASTSNDLSRKFGLQAQHFSKEMQCINETVKKCVRTNNEAPLLAVVVMKLLAYRYAIFLVQSYREYPTGTFYTVEKSSMNLLVALNLGAYAKELNIDPVIDALFGIWEIKKKSAYVDTKQSLIKTFIDLRDVFKAYITAVTGEINKIMNVISSVNDTQFDFVSEMSTPHEALTALIRHDIIMIGEDLELLMRVDYDKYASVTSTALRIIELCHIQPISRRRPYLRSSEKPRAYQMIMKLKLN